jgi:hypothetical protein
MIETPSCYLCTKCGSFRAFNEPAPRIRDYVNDLSKLPKDELKAGVAATKEDQGGFVEYQRDIGKPGGWTLSAAGEWMRRAGGRVAVAVGWKK